MALAHVDDILTLRPSEVIVALIALMRAFQNVALIGAPGCGKSSFIAQVCEMLGWPSIVSLPAVEDPTEPGGFPDLDASRAYAKKVLFWHAYQAVNAQEPTNWHWEDFGGAMTSTQLAYMQWAWAREVSGYQLPPHVAITMATNRKMDRAGVQGILETIKGRFTLIHVQSNLEDFLINLDKRGEKEYGLDRDVMDGTAAYLHWRSENLNDFQPTADMTNSPTERNWVGAMRIRSFHLPDNIETALVAGRIGKGVGTEYLNFERTRKSLPNIADIFRDPEHVTLPERIDIYYAVSVELAARCTPQNFMQIVTYALRMEELQPDVAALMVQSCRKKCPAIEATPAYAKLILSDVGKFLTGRVT